MKIVLLAGLLFPLFLSAQDCKLIKEKDPYTKELKISTGFITLQAGASVSIDANSKEIDLYFTLPGKCLDDASSVFIFYEGSKTKATFRNAGSMNCDGDFHYILRNSATVTPTLLNKLSTVNVTQFVFTGTDKKAITISLLPDQQKILLASAACIATEAKTLVK
ncbi:MAG: hypothetical protein ABI480_01195 [Chitinophagaceae bacterium]